MAIFSRTSTAYNSDGSLVQANASRFDNMTGVYNLIKNGDFSNGFTSWYGLNSYSIVNNVCRYLATAIYQGATQLLANPLTYRGHKLYFAGSWKADTTNVTLILNDSKAQTLLSYTGSGEFIRKSSIMTISQLATSVYIRIQDNRSSGWTETQCKDFVVIDLTDQYGAGNEPTLAQCDVLFANWYTNKGLRIEEATTNLIPNTTSYSDSVQTVTVQGKNLFDKAKVATGKYLLPTDGTIGNTNYNNDVSAYITIVAGNQYTISGNSYVQPAVSVGLAWFNSALVYISGTSYGGATGNGTYTAPANAAYLRYTVNAIDINTSQVELGATATSYETFVPNSPSPDYPSPITSNVPAGTYKISDGTDWYEFTLSDDLRGIGSVMDILTFDKIGHTGSINKKCGKVILNGTQSVYINPVINNLFRAILYVSGIQGNIGGNTVITTTCDRFNSLGRLYYDSPSQECCISTYNGQIGIVILPNRGVTSLATLNTWLAANPLTVIYQLATPTTANITFTKNNASTAPTIPSAYTYSPSETLTTPITLDVTSGSAYTVSCKTGTITLSGAGSGTVTPTSPITFTASTTAITLTPAPTATYNQVELKNYATSWQMGKIARTPQEQLTIPASVLDYREGTIEFDYMPINQPLSDMTAQVKSPKIMQIGNYSSANSLTVWRLPQSSVDRIALFGNYSSGWKLNTRGYYNFPSLNNKCRIALRWKTANTFDVLVNGIPIIQNTVSTIPFTAMGNIILGDILASGGVNALFSNIRVSNIARTDTELAYTGDLSVDEYTTYFLPLHDNLGAQTAPRIITVPAEVLTVQERTGGGYRSIATRDRVTNLLTRKAAYHPHVTVNLEGSTRQSRIGSGNRTAMVIAPTHVDIIEPSVELSLDVIERKSETEVIGVPYIGDTITLQVKFYTFGGTLADPTDIMLKFFDTLGNQIGPSVSIGSQYRISAGVYQYDYTVPNGYRTIFYEFSALQGTTPQLRPGKIFCKKRVDS